MLYFVSVVDKYVMFQVITNVDVFHQSTRVVLTKKYTKDQEKTRLNDEYMYDSKWIHFSAIFRSFYVS